MSDYYDISTCAFLAWVSCGKCPQKKYQIKLDPEERCFLEFAVCKQKMDASKRSKARVLLFTDENAPEGSISDEVIADRTG